MDVSSILEKSVKEAAEKYKSITVDKHLDLEYDLGNLLALDSNDINSTRLRQAKNDYLLQLTRDNVQLLLNKVWDLSTEQVDEAIVVRLPPSTFLLPRAKPVPKPKALTKWQQFALTKGIQKKKKAKLSWDDQLKKWVPLYGFKRAVAEKERDWVLEVPDNANPLEDQFAKRTAARSERVSKNELQRLRNIAKSRSVKVPRVGVTNPDVSTAKDLQAAITVARSSTASLGKFQAKLPKEKEAKGVIDIVPGASRKRKMGPTSSQEEHKRNMDIIDTVLNKRPKLDIEKAVARHINTQEVGRSEEKKNIKPKAGKRGKSKPRGISKKPAKSQRKVKNTGRKRR